MSEPVCAIVGVGPGNGAAFGRRFSREGHRVALCARSLDVLVLKGVVAYVKTALGNGNGLTTFSLGTLDEPQRWGTAIARTLAAESNVGQYVAHREDPISSALDVYVMADAGSFDGTGVIVLSYSGWLITPLQTA